jgi:hypothetical protein
LFSSTFGTRLAIVKSVNVLSQIPQAATQATPAALVAVENSLVQTGAGNGVLGFAETFSGVVGEKLSKADALTDTAAATNLESSIRWPFATGAKSAGMEGMHWESSTFVAQASTQTVDPAGSSNGKTSIPESGRTKQRTQNTERQAARVITADAAANQTNAILVVAPTIGIDPKSQTEQPVAQEGVSDAHIEKETASVASDRNAVKGDVTRQSLQPEETFAIQKTIPELRLPVETARAPINTKTLKQIASPLVQIGTEEISSGRPNDSNALVPTSPIASEEIATLSTPAGKDVIEMSVQEHFETPGKKMRQVSLGGEPTSLLRTPETQAVANGMQVEAVPLRSAATPISVESSAGPANSDPFAVMDASLPEPAPQLLHSSHHDVEVGVNDPTYGWVEVRTHKYGGEITATLTASSTESHRNLGTQLSGLTDYLSTRDIPINKVVMEGMTAANSGGQQSRHSGSDGKGQGSTEDAAPGFTTAPLQLEETTEAQPSQYRYSSQIHLLA